MTDSGFTKLSTESSTGISSQAPSSLHYHPYTGNKHHGENVTRLLSWREVSPAGRQLSRKFLGGSPSVSLPGLQPDASYTNQALKEWLEADSFKNCTAKYCPLQPAPRSTIAAAFSSDGTILASTHGDHTVKIICCKTGLCLKTLCGHRRTPWVVRFHPIRSDVLASGSLDNEVKIWNANTAECIASHDFHRPIASIAFHAEGHLLAVASGHKLYIWKYSSQEGDTASPAIVLRTRRSLRNVHFHPRAVPLLLTAEVKGLDAPDCPMTLATSPGYLQCSGPPSQQPFGNLRLSGNLSVSNPESSSAAAPWILPAAWISENSLGATQAEHMAFNRNGVQQGPSPAAETTSADEDIFEFTGNNIEGVPMDISPWPVQVCSLSLLAEAAPSEATRDMEEDSNNKVSGAGTLQRAAEGQAFAGRSDSSNPFASGAEVMNSSLTPRLLTSETRESLLGVTLPLSVPDRQTNATNVLPISPHVRPPFQAGELPGWESPFLHGLVMGQTHAGLVQATLHSPQNGILMVPSVPLEARGQHHHINDGAVIASTSSLASVRNSMSLGNSRGSRVQGAGQRRPGMTVSAEGSSVGVETLQGLSSRDPHVGMIAGETSPQMSIAMAVATAELPCTVKLRIWPHDVKHASAALEPETCRLMIPHAVLCSEMGAHFSPCGRFLAACVACVLPPVDSDARPPLNDAAASEATSPTRHHMSAQQIIYELRVYSLEAATFGQVLVSRAIRAAHCLTSIQFSPTSNHILLAYGRRHSSLLRSVVVNRTTAVPIFTILEIYRVSDMELVKVLLSAEDEVNVACFHPMVGGGLAYGTKEGRLRIFKHERSDTDL